MTQPQLPPRPDGSEYAPEHFRWLRQVAPLFVGLTRAEAQDLAVRLRVKLAFGMPIMDGKRALGELVAKPNFIFLQTGEDGRVEDAAADSLPEPG